MGSTNPEPSDTKPLSFDPADIGNSGPFMDSLVEFLNEATLCMLKVKRNAGISPECGQSVPMNDEEKNETLNSILTTLGHKCQLELEKDEEDSDDCDCPTEMDEPIPPSRPMPTERRMDTQRPGTNAMRGRGPPPGQYNMAAARSTPMNYRPAATPYPAYAASRQEPRGRPNMMDPRGVSGGYNDSCAPGCTLAGTAQARRRPF